jgi:site-specific DNA-methyltransferase (adenine-specific)
MKLLQGDCLEVMKELPDGSVDMVLTDPPYGTTACKWDSVIPFEPMWVQLKRVIKKNGAIVMTAGQPFTSALIMSNVKMFKYCWVWEKNAPAGFAQAKNKPMTKHEDVVVFSLAKTGHVSQCKNRMVYHPQGIIPFGKEVKNSKSYRGSAFEARKNARSSYVQEFTGYPNSVINIPVERSGLHPTQKPVALMEFLIKTYTNEGETVLDFTMGSGTTGVACANTGRDFIGIELDETYFGIAQDRIKEAQKEIKDD